jgi:hypothetical protein
VTTARDIDLIDTLKSVWCRQLVFKANSILRSENVNFNKKNCLNFRVSKEFI